MYRDLVLVYHVSVSLSRAKKNRVSGNTMSSRNLVDAIGSIEICTPFGILIYGVEVVANVIGSMRYVEQNWVRKTSLLWNGVQ